MRYMIGYQRMRDDRLKTTILRYKESISEIYFSWGEMPSGRGTMEKSGNLFPFEAQREMLEELKEYSRSGIGMNLLLNGNCYGRMSQARVFFEKIGETVEFLSDHIRLTSVTTTSPLIAKFIRQNFADLETRASVNMEIGTVEGIEYIQGCFDGFYLKREWNYDRLRLEAMHRYCREQGKKLFLLANSGCLNFCSARTFHDNLVAHQHEIAGMDNGFEFPGICHEFLRNPEHRATLLDRSNFIRPEDISLFEGLCDGLKLATRTNRDPATIVAAYLTGHFSGNLLELTEPAHAASFYPEIIANDRIPTDYATRRFRGESCAGIQKNATLLLEEINADQ